ncbi:palmitoyltransferase ZDHHC23 [Gastrophryne carolinensis]
MSGGKRKKRGARLGQEEEDALCCCEYINQNGERSHLAACLCDCQDLDQACDRWITCKSLQPEVLARAMETASDRFRVPWIRGARKVDVSIVPPLVVLPVSLQVASLHWVLGAAVLSALPLLVIWYYQLTHRTKGRTLLFLSLALFSLAYMYYHFLRQVFLRGHVGRGHMSALTCGLLLILFLLRRAKGDPGYLRTCAAHKSWEKEPPVTDKNWCQACRLLRPPRSAHCRICGNCVRRLDHHCVWINNCIGSRNHGSFILLLVVFMFTSVYGISITLGAICQGQYVLSALFYCPGVYADYSTSFAFTCVWYCAIVTGGIAYLLLVQLLNISYNVTEREARVALREKSGRRFLAGLVVDPGTFNQGLYHNWLHFLSLADRSEESATSDLV